MADGLGLVTSAMREPDVRIDYATIGALHLANLYVLNKLRRRAQYNQQISARPPVAPDAVWTVPAR